MGDFLYICCMEKEFVDYTEALDLKELGFDGPCCGYYDHLIKELDDISSEVCERLCKHDTHIKAPTYSQAFRFFREKYRLWQIVQQNTDKDWTYDIMPITGMIDYELFDVFDTYEEAELECLKKLIEIVKEK